MAKARTTVVVKQSPTAAVAVSSERFILRTISTIIIIYFYLSCIWVYFLDQIYFYNISNVSNLKKKPHNCEAGWWGTLFLNQFK